MRPDTNGKGTVMADKHTAFSRMAVTEMVLTAVLLVAAFAAIAASDVDAMRVHALWMGLVVVYGVVAFIVDRLHSGRSLTDLHSAWRILLHWAGVFIAAQFAYSFVASGRMANLDAGLTYGLILGLGTYTAGVYSNWRLMVVGAALGLATLGVALVEQYLWVLIGITIVAIIVLVLGGRFAARLLARRGGHGTETGTSG